MRLMKNGLYVLRPKTCGKKIRFTNEFVAELYATIIHGVDDMRAYHCPICGYYHNGHLSEATV